MPSENDELARTAEAFDLLHGTIMGRTLPQLAGTMHGRDLSFSQLTTIMRVFLEGPKSITEIARDTDITHNAASRMVDRLVKAGIMSRIEDPSDRRQKVVSLTEFGKTIPPEWRNATIKAYVEVLKGLAHDDLRQLSVHVRQLVSLLPPLPPAFEPDPR